MQRLGSLFRRQAYPKSLLALPLRALRLCAYLFRPELRAEAQRTQRKREGLNRTGKFPFLNL